MKKYNVVGKSRFLLGLIMYGYTRFTRQDLIYLLQAYSLGLEKIRAISKSNIKTNNEKNLSEDKIR